LQYQPHERKERNSQQCLVRHLPKDAIRYRSKQIDRQKSHFNADETKGKTDKGQRESHRVAKQQHDHQRKKHQRREIFRNKSNHIRSPQSYLATASSMATVSGMRPCRIAMRLMSSEMPCNASSPKPMGINTQTGQRTSPPVLLEVSPLAILASTMGHDR